MKSSLNETSFAGSSLGPSEGHSSWSHSTFVIPFIIPNISFAVPSHATHALEKATLMNKQLPNPKHVDTLVELTYKRGSATWDAPKEDINKWLADELHHRLRRNQMAIAETAKGFLLMYELLIRGDECFVKAVARHPDFFSVEFMPVDVAVAAEPQYASLLRFVASFVHSHFETFKIFPGVRQMLADMWARDSDDVQLPPEGDPFASKWDPSASTVVLLRETNIKDGTCGPIRTPDPDEARRFHLASRLLLDWADVGIDTMATLKFIMLMDPFFPDCPIASVVCNHYVQRSECSPSRPLQCVGCCSTTRPDCGS